MASRPHVHVTRDRKTAKFWLQPMRPEYNLSFLALDSRSEEPGSTQRSLGVRPLRFAIRASMRGPISSLSWNAKMKSSHDGRSSVRWEPDWRLILQPILRRAARTRLALVAGQLLKRPET